MTKEKKKKKDKTKQEEVKSVVRKEYRELLNHLDVGRHKKVSVP